MSAMTALLADMERRFIEICADAAFAGNTLAHARAALAEVHAWQAEVESAEAEHYSRLRNRHSATAGVQ